MDKDTSQIYQTSSETAAEIQADKVCDKDPSWGGVKIRPATGVVPLWSSWR